MTGSWSLIQYVFQQNTLQLSQQSVQICSQVGLKHAPATNFKIISKLYVEPMQYNNPYSKWSENIPYMIIYLEHGRGIYLGKDTVVAYAREEDKSCDYLKINEIVQLADLTKDLSTKSRGIVESDLVFSPAQVTEH